MKRKKIKIERTELFTFKAKGPKNLQRGTTETENDPTTTMITSTVTGLR